MAKKAPTGYCTVYGVKITKHNFQKVQQDRYNKHADYYDYMGMTADKLEPHIGGMAYYKDRDLTKLEGIDCYHFIRKSKFIKIYGWTHWCEVVAA